MPTEVRSIEPTATRPKADALFSPLVRRLGLAWVAVSLPFVTVVSAFVHTRDAYIFVLIYMACGAYTMPALLVAWFATRKAPRSDLVGFLLLYAGLASAFLIGVAVLVGLATGWRWANPLGAPAVAASGLVHSLGVAHLVRNRSGRRALSVDVIESLAVMVAVTAPMWVLWGPAVLGAEDDWFTVPCAVAVLVAIPGTYWALMLAVRLGPGRGLFELSAVALGLVGTVNVALQAAQGVSGFTLPYPPLVALTALCMSQYLLIPLNAPLLLRQGLNRLPLAAQVRGGSLATVVTLVGAALLLGVTAEVADERSWAVPFALGTVSLLLVLAGLRQIAAVAETRRLYRQVEQVSDERQRLMSQLLERNLHDRHNFAAQLYEQAVAAYTSFALLAGTGDGEGEAGSALGRATALVGGDLARHAESVRGLVQAIRPLDATPGGSGGPGGSPRRGRGGPPGERLGIPMRAYLASIYGDHPTPQLTIEVADDLALDWISETVLLQIAQEALHNVWRHSNAGRVDIVIEAESETAADPDARPRPWAAPSGGQRGPDDGPGAVGDGPAVPGDGEGGEGLPDRPVVAMCVADDGNGFDVASVPEGSGFAVMRASAAVVGGTL
ncbi:MAG TPA: hypothetical protein VIL36_18130, partial [Acidimicrobiales bacterium]